MGYYNYYKLLLFCCYNSATRRKQDLRPRPRSLPGATSAPLFSGEPPPPSQALDARSSSPPPPDWACSSGPAGSGLGRPAPLPERGPPPAHRLRRAPGGRWGRGGGEEPPHGAGVPEPPRTFLREVPRLGAGAAGRGGESGVPGRSRSAPPLHNMASSASSSAAGAEGTPPAQVSAAPPPTCGFLPARARGDRGARETGGSGGGSPLAALSSWGLPDGDGEARGGDPAGGRGSGGA